MTASRLFRSVVNTIYFYFIKNVSVILLFIDYFSAIAINTRNIFFYFLKQAFCKKKQAFNVWQSFIYLLRVVPAFWQTHVFKYYFSSENIYWPDIIREAYPKEALFLASDSVSGMTWKPKGLSSVMTRAVFTRHMGMTSCLENVKVQL